MSLLDSEENIINKLNKEEIVWGFLKPIISKRLFIDDAEICIDLNKLYNIIYYYVEGNNPKKIVITTGPLIGISQDLPQCYTSMLTAVPIIINNEIYRVTLSYILTRDKNELIRY